MRAEPITADVSAVSRWSQTLPDEYLLCRDIGHLWRPLTARFNPEENTYLRTMRCGRCRTERHQTLSLAGMVLAGHYDYADDYLAPQGQGRLTGQARGSLRLESVIRTISHDEGQAR
jgi:hypothetical protein